MQRDSRVQHGWTVDAAWNAFQLGSYTEGGKREKEVRQVRPIAECSLHRRTNVQLGTVNRPRLCIYPALILLAIFVLLSFFSRIWCSEGNLPLQLWQSRSSIRDITDSSNPMFPYGTETHYAPSAAF